MFRTFVWAILHQYRVTEGRGGRVQIDLGSGGVWRLVCNGELDWSLNDGPVESPEAYATISDDSGRRLFTGAAYPPETLVLRGPPSLCEPLLQVRAVIV